MLNPVLGQAGAPRQDGTAPRTPGGQADAAPLRYRLWRDALIAQPWRIDLFQALRRIEAAHPHLPAFGTAQRPAEEPVRIGQPAELSFAPAALQQVQDDGRGRLRIDQRGFGLLGPNGPLPIHLTEFVRDRRTHHSDPTVQRWMDLLTHRFAMLFYRAWSQGQLDGGVARQDKRSSASRQGALAGIGLAQLQSRDALGNQPRLAQAGRLVRPQRDVEGLEAWCTQEFGVPVRVEPWCGQWMPLASAERSRLQQRPGVGQQLGRGAVLGEKVWDLQHKFRLHIGPLNDAQYRSFLPGGHALARLRALVLHWVGLELAWDVRLLLQRPEVPRLQLQKRVPGQAPERAARLGLSTWLGQPRHDAPLADLRLDVQDRLTPLTS